MTDQLLTMREAELVRVGNALARSIGHVPGRCPKISPAVPCTCGAGKQQQLALADWDDLVQDITGVPTGSKFYKK
jgi:hypothetical protein